MAQVVQPKRKRINFVVNIALTLLAVYLLYLFIGTYIKINEKSSTVDDQNVQIAKKSEENERLNGVLGAECDDEYIEQIARELGYVNSDEKVYESIRD